MAKKLEQSVMQENNRYREEMNIDESQPVDDDILMAQQSVLQVEQEREALYESGSVEDVMQEEFVQDDRVTAYESSVGSQEATNAPVQEETSLEQMDYKNMVAKMIAGIAGMFPEDSSIGKSLQSVADKLEGVVTKSDADLSTMQGSSDDKAAQETKEASVYGRELDENAEEAERQAELEMLRNRDVTGFEEKSDSELIGMTKEEASEYTLDKRAFELQESEKQLEGNSSHPSEGSSYIQSMEKRAVTDVELDEMVRAADTKPGDFKSASGAMLRMNESLSGYAAGEMAGIDAGDTQKANVANAYMNVMRGISAYDTKAKETIDLKYADDPEMKEKALTGLGNMMQQTVADGYNMVGQADRIHNCLSDADRQELNNMSFTGVSLSYSDYQDLQQSHAYDAGSYSPEEAMYGEAGLQDDWNTNSSEKDTSSQRDSLHRASKGQRDYSSKSENHSDYGAKAMEKFGHILDAAKESQFNAERDMGE